MSTGSGNETGLGGGCLDHRLFASRDRNGLNALIFHLQVVPSLLALFEILKVPQTDAAEEKKKKKSQA